MRRRYPAIPKMNPLSSLELRAVTVTDDLVSVMFILRMIAAETYYNSYELISDQKRSLASLVKHKL